MCMVMQSAEAFDIRAILFDTTPGYPVIVYSGNDRQIIDLDKFRFRFSLKN